MVSPTRRYGVVLSCAKPSRRLSSGAAEGSGDLRPAEGSLEVVRPPGDLATPQAPCQRPGSVGCGRPWSPEPSDLSLPEPGSGAQGHPERCDQAAALGQLQSQECEGLGPGNQITQEKKQSPTHTEMLLYKQHVTSV